MLMITLYFPAQNIYSVPKVLTHVRGFIVEPLSVGPTKQALNRSGISVETFVAFQLHCDVMF